MYNVRLSKHAVKDMDDVPDPVGQRINAALEALIEHPRPPGCKRIRGVDDTYRIRVGDYRVLYDVDDASRSVLVLRVQHRKDAYRNI